MAGRPPKYESPEELEKAVELYFSECEEKDEVPLLSGLALSLGFASRQSLWDYAKKEQFSYILEHAKLVCEHELNLRGLTNKVNSNMAKMNLASSYGFSDKQQVEHSGRQEIVYLDKQDEDL